VTSPLGTPNRDLLVRTARRLAPLLGELVLVGGHVAELLVTDPAATRVRPTDDVDVVVRVATRAQYHVWEERLQRLGFSPDASAGAPICRRRSSDGLVLDVMPTDEQILGFSNRWYPLAVDTAEWITLDGDLRIRAASAPAFLATKWVAFKQRGAGDAMDSHDFEDIVMVIAGRPSVVDEIAAAPDEVRTWLAERTRAFLEGRWAEDAIEGALPDARLVPGFFGVVVERFHAIGSL
jgi:predicted nucleotidyltransferase